MEKIEAKGTWDWGSLAEWDDVSNDAINGGYEVHYGHLFGIMVEKGSEFPEGGPRRYFKYRVVFQGNMVTDQKC